MAVTNEVAAWLASFKMDKYAHTIVVENGCDTMASVLEDLDEDALEGMGVIQQKLPLVSLSEQELVDCCHRLKFQEAQ